ncbi:arylsulfatase regulator [Citrobacter sp. U14242]|uniref:arylsulfatase regulator n=1 Tax=Citrobacter sp. U14242 TaxID=3390192 RepID=UPI003978EB28
MIDLTAEQRQLAKIVHDYACRFPLTENGDVQLLQGCYDYIDALKRVNGQRFKSPYEQHLPQYSGYLRFAKCMERLAQDIPDCVIEASKDH